MMQLSDDSLNYSPTTNTPTALPPADRSAETSASHSMGDQTVIMELDGINTSVPNDTGMPNYPPPVPPPAPPMEQLLDEQRGRPQISRTLFDKGEPRRASSSRMSSTSRRLTRENLELKKRLAMTSGQSAHLTNIAKEQTWRANNLQEVAETAERRSNVFRDMFRKVRFCVRRLSTSEL